MDLGVVTVSSITLMCFLIAEAIKLTSLDKKWLPVICGGCGMLLGIGSFLLGVPDMPAQDIINAAIIGAASGFASTGVHQVYKQLSDSDDE